MTVVESFSKEFRVANEYCDFEWDYIRDDNAAGDAGDGGGAEDAGAGAGGEDVLAQYKELGSPDEILAVIKKQNDELAALRAKATPEKKPTPGNLKPEQAEAIRKDLLEMFPELAEISKIKENLKEVAEVTETVSQKDARKLAKEASKQVEELVVASGYEKDASSFIEDVVANRIYSDPKLYARFVNHDADVVAEVFRGVEKQFLSKHVVRTKKLSDSQLSDLLSGKAGKTTGKPKEGSTEGSQESSNPTDRLRQLGKEAFEFMETFTASRG